MIDTAYDYRILSFPITFLIVWMRMENGALTACFDPNQLRVSQDIPEPPDPRSLKFFETQSVSFTDEYGHKRNGKVDGVVCSYVFCEPEKGWKEYYDIRWVGTGHTNKLFTADQIQ